LSVHWYGVCIVTGMVLALLLACAREKRYGLPKDTALDLVLCGIPSAIVGARLYFVLFSLPEYVNGPWWRVFAVWEGGLAVYGGLIFGVLAGYIYGRIKKLPFGKLLALAAPCMALGQALGRWGNFFNQEAYGSAIQNPRFWFFPAGVQIDGVWHYATFFYESAWCFGIVLFLLWCEKRQKCEKESDVFLMYVFLYAMERTVVEGLRTGQPVSGGPCACRRC
jgi:prolipoprotein diacylglyceryl transferase